MSHPRPTRRWLPLALLAAACSNPAESTSVFERLRIVSRPDQADTVSAQPVQAVVVEVRDEAGALAAGIVVRFMGLPATGSPLVPSMLVEAADGSTYSEAIAETTDARGRASALVQFGSAAGAGRVQVSVPESGKADTASFTIDAGAAASIVISPRATTIYAGVPVQFSGRVVDRFQNPRNDPVTFTMTAVPGGPGAISPTGLLTGAGTGLVTVAVAAGTARDTALVSVVPQGTFAAVDYTSGLILAGLDGSGRRVLRAPVSDYLEPAWAPDGSELVVAPLASAGSFDRQPLVGAATTVVLSPNTDLGGLYWPAYSPDGEFLYFSNVQGIAGGIARSKKDGSEVEVLLSGELFRPSISHDGRYMAYHAASSESDLVVIRVFDLLTRTLLFGEQPGRFPEWSPTSDSLVAIDELSRRLFIMHRDGSGRRFLTGADHPYPDGQLSWSPDAKWILARGPSFLELIQVATGVILPLRFTQSEVEPAWRPGN